MMFSSDLAGRDTAIRVLRTRRSYFVEFELQWGGDADLAVELVLPYPAFREFCRQNRSRMLPIAGEARLGYEQLRRAYETNGSSEKTGIMEPS